MNRPCALSAIASLLVLATGAALAAGKFFLTPGVTLRVVSPAEPGLVFTNRTRRQVYPVQYSVVLWRLDRTDGNPLRRANEQFGALAPGESSTIVKLFGMPEIRSGLRTGDKVVGAVGIGCAVCARGYNYRVYISYGEGGWFAEVPDVTDSGLVLPSGYSDGALHSSNVELSLLRWINEIAVSTRISIEPTTK